MMPFPAATGTSSNRLAGKLGHLFNSLRLNIDTRLNRPPLSPPLFLPLHRRRVPVAGQIDAQQQHSQRGSQREGRTVA